MVTPLSPLSDAGLSRNEKLLYRIDRSAKILEIGPSYNPVAPKAEGWNCFFIDHEDQSNLREKYKSAGVNIDCIEPVDFIWRDGPLEEVIPQEHIGTFDACIASHVIEHFPNPVQVLQSLQRILKPEGLLSLAVPDKRYCFDYFKPLSMTGDLLYANFLKATRHSRPTAFNFVAYYCTNEGLVAWLKKDVTELKLVHSLDEAKKHFEQHSESPEHPYVDHHAWHYTPSSFRLVILELNALDVVDWTEDVFFPSVGFEFFVTLKRGKARFPSHEEQQQRRLALLLLGTIRDVQEQCGYLLAEMQDEAANVSAAPPTNSPGGELSLVISQQAELMRRMDKQGRQIRKIWEAVRVLKAAARPLRAAGRTSVDFCRRGGDLWKDAADKVRNIWR